MNEKKSSPKDGRTRNWTFLVWEESAPKNWRDIIDEWHVPWIESPLHEHDTNPDETNKKSHWHILILFEGVKSFEQVKELTDSLNTTIPQIAQNAKGVVRYMIHMDNPEKYQYNVSSIIGHAGADVSEYLKPTGASRYAMIREMAQYIKDNCINEYNDFFFYVMDNRYDDWFPLLCDNATYVITALIKSNRYSSYKQIKNVRIDKETGEIQEIE